MPHLDDKDVPIEEIKDDEALLVRMRERFKLMQEAHKENNDAALKDFKFIYEPGSQWTEELKAKRGNRPCYEFNKIRVTAKRVINDMRANRASGKVRGQEGGDKETAEILNGLIRNIWSVSDADSITDAASEYQVGAGKGAWRVTTGYTADDAFEQDIKIEPVDNPFCLLSDPMAKDQLKRDAEDWIYTEKVSKASYKAKWPNADPISFEDESDDDEDWQDDESVRIAEYWYKVPTTKLLLQLQDGKVVDGESDEAQLIPPDQIKNRREVKTHKIMMFIASGDAILEQPTEWAGSLFPWVECYGEYMVIDGKTVWHGIGRHAKDAQRSYNIARTAISETISSAPLFKYWATAAQSEGHMTKWSIAHNENIPVAVYNADPKAPGPPQRQGGADVPVALMQESQMASEEINMVSGIFAADVGAANQANSGKQEIARQQQGAIATFNYPDNRAKSIQLTWEILLDLVPKIYDTERELRVLGSDGEEDYKRVNTFVKDDMGNEVKINDLSVGRYDVTITTGPSFSTRRQEFAETVMPLFNGNPEMMMAYGDLLYKSMDLPYSDEMAERAKAMLPPPIQAMLNKDTEVPPEVQNMMAQAKQAMEQVQMHFQEVQQAAQETGLEKAEVEKLTADLETKAAKFDAKVAKEIARIAEKEAKLTIQAVSGEKDAVIQEGNQVIEQNRMTTEEQLAGQMAQAVEYIAQQAQQFNEMAVQVMGDIKTAAESRPIVKEVRMERENGKPVAVPVYQ